MFKKTLSLVLAAMLIISTMTVTSFAATQTSYTEAGENLLLMRKLDLSALNEGESANTAAGKFQGQNGGETYVVAVENNEKYLKLTTTNNQYIGIGSYTASSVPEGSYIISDGYFRFANAALGDAAPAVGVATNKAGYSLGSGANGTQTITISKNKIYALSSANSQFTEVQELDSISNNTWVRLTTVLNPADGKFHVYVNGEKKTTTALSLGATFPATDGYYSIAPAYRVRAWKAATVDIKDFAIYAAPSETLYDASTFATTDNNATVLVPEGKLVTDDAVAGASALIKKLDLSSKAVDSTFSSGSGLNQAQSVTVTVKEDTDGRKYANMATTISKTDNQVRFGGSDFTIPAGDKLVYDGWYRFADTDTSSTAAPTVGGGETPSYSFSMRSGATTFVVAKDKFYATYKDAVAGKFQEVEEIYTLDDEDCADTWVRVSIVVDPEINKAHIYIDGVKRTSGDGVTYTNPAYDNGGCKVPTYEGGNYSITDRYMQITFKGGNDANNSPVAGVDVKDFRIYSSPTGALVDAAAFDSATTVAEDVIKAENITTNANAKLILARYDANGVLVNTTIATHVAYEKALENGETVKAFVWDMTSGSITPLVNAITVE